jgi:hypothetical protein
MGFKWLFEEAMEDEGENGSGHEQDGYYKADDYKSATFISRASPHAKLCLQDGDDWSITVTSCRAVQG